MLKWHLMRKLIVLSKNLTKLSTMVEQFLYLKLSQEKTSQEVLSVATEAVEAVAQELIATNKSLR